MFVPRLAQAGLYGAVDGLYLSDTFTAGTSSSSSRTYFGLDIIAGIDNKSKFYAGFHVHQFGAQDTAASTTTNLTSLDMGPFLRWVIDRKKTFAVSLGYNILAKGTYKTAGVNSTLDGTSILASFEITPEISENLFAGVKFNYLDMSYVKSTVGSVASTVSFNRNMIFPSLTLSWRH